MKIDKQTIFEIHRLNDLSWSERKIARHLRVSRPTVNKYLINPDLSPAKRAPRPSKLDAHRDLIKQFVEADAQVRAPVVLQRLQDNGFDGKITIVRRLPATTPRPSIKATGLYPFRIPTGPANADRLGSLWKSSLRADYAKALCLCGHRVLQPDARTLPCRI